MSLRNNDWRNVVRVLGKFNFQIVRQRGSHLILSDGEKFISVPRHSPIAMGTLREILLEAKVSEANFVKKL
ncbi:type II toxin-antitoxin system HicA family toxin [Candidatus Nitrosotenuis chungbukensis]|uniref:type II toxin-antitoxin system HicA family toxin n=1 Tax=Candidatus Nitrosotenuis chungbukensis TaxID=1353246 RepID=UPI000977861D|nr:type II toxin-antitoxin system HicA family toxin [Candidatus Nitrosotenuis chungbukensis]